jgi:hypothetical protein
MGGVEPCVKSLKAGGAEAGETPVTVGAMMPMLSMFEMIGPTDKTSE